MGLNHSKPRLKRRSNSRLRRIRQNPDGISSSVGQTSNFVSKFPPPPSSPPPTSQPQPKCANFICPCARTHELDGGNKSGKTRQFSSSPSPPLGRRRCRRRSFGDYVKIPTTTEEKLYDRSALKVELPPESCGGVESIKICRASYDDVLLGGKQAQHGSSPHPSHRQPSSVNEEYTFYFTEMNTSSARQELITRLTSSICGIVHSKLDHLSSHCVPTTRATPPAAIKVQLSVLPGDTAVVPVAKKPTGEEEGRREERQRRSESSYYREENLRVEADASCERQRHYHQIPGTDAQRIGALNHVDSITSSLTAASTTTTTTKSSHQHHYQERCGGSRRAGGGGGGGERGGGGEGGGGTAPRYNLGIKRMSEAWKRHVSPTDERFYQIVNSRLREWQKRAPERTKRKATSEENGTATDEHATPSHLAAYKLIWPESAHFESGLALHHSSSDSEYGGGDEESSDPAATRRDNKGVLRMYQPLSERDIEAITGIGNGSCVVNDCGQVVASSTAAAIAHHTNGGRLSPPPQEKQAKKRRRVFSFMRKSRAEAAHERKEEEEEEDEAVRCALPSASSRHGYLRANSIDPGAPYPFPNTPGVTTAPFALVPVSHNHVSSSSGVAAAVDTTSMAIGNMQPVSLIVQRHCHEYVHHHHYYYPPVDKNS